MSKIKAYCFLVANAIKTVKEKNINKAYALKNFKYFNFK